MIALNNNPVLISVSSFTQIIKSGWTELISHLFTNVKIYHNNFKLILSNQFMI